MSALLVLDLLFRGMAIGGLASLGAALARGPASRDARIAGGLFAASVAAYAVNSSTALRDLVGPLDVAVWLLSVAGGGYVWLFLTVLFEDRRVTWASLAPAGALTALGLIGMAASGSVRPVVWIVHNVVELGLALHALRFIVRSWRGDLIEARRRLRGPFLAAVAVYMMVLSGFEIAESLGYDSGWHREAGAVSLGLFCLAAAATFLAPRAALLDGPRVATPAPAETAGDAQDAAIAGRLDTLMTREALWRREGLTIGALAEALQAPEHRVRRVINGLLGHRNFAAFVNAYRIAAAKDALADPANAGRTVAAIAFDLGFGSLGPFNRAFKEATGRTPTEFRQAALAEASPKA